MAKNLIQQANAGQLNKANNQQPPAAQSVNQLMNSILDGEKLRGRFNDLLGKRAPQFVSSLVTMVNADQNLQKAFYESPMTVIQSALKAAAFDLPIDPSLGYAYIVPFNNYRKDLDRKVMEASFILGWKGMNQLALRTGAYKVINVVDVREGEMKRYNRLTEEMELEFIEDEDTRQSKPVIGYVGYYRLVNGAEKTIYMTVKQIENHEKRFRKGQYMGKGWRDDWDAMARKTIYRILIGKYGLMSITYQTQAEGVETADVIRDEFTDMPAPGVIDTDGAYPVDANTGEVIEGA